MSPINWIYLLIGLLVVGIVVVVILFVTRAPPYNQPYKFRDPRTWKSVSSNKDWLIPEFDYGPYSRSEPSEEIIDIYNGLIVALGGTPVVY